MRLVPRASLPILFAAACSSAGEGIVATAGTSPPNIVYILADDLGWGDVGCYWPDSKIPTPNLDRLAEEGMRFTDAHSPDSVCTPTRYAILTGRYAWRTWLRASVLLEWDRPLIEPDRPTVPAFLREHGYATACVGKWHLGWDWPVVGDWRPAELDPSFDFGEPIGGGPTTRGFDEYFGDDVTHFPPYVFFEGDRTVGIPSEDKPWSMYGPPGPMVPGWKFERVMPEITKRAVRIIDERAEEGRPFFLYFALTAPHTPIAPDEPFKGKSEAGAYGDFVFQIDDAVGQVMAALERNGLTEETLLVFTSDNGSPARNGERMSGELNSVVTDFDHRPSGPWRGLKADIYEGGHRVPLLVRWPGRVEPGSITDEVVCHVDLFATLASVVGAELPAGAAPDSYDILPVLEGAELEGPLREATVHHSIDGMFAIRQGGWKLVLGLGSGGWTEPSRVVPKPGGPIAQLYDLRSDPGESTNVFDEHPDVVERLATLMKEYAESGRSVER